MSDQALFFNCAGLAYLLQSQLWLWLAPDRARVQLQDKLDKRHGPNTEHAEEARTAIPAIRAVYFVATLLWLSFLIRSLV